jgi:diacylglycerol kinase (ATP)
MIDLNKNNGFIKGRIKSLKFAFCGALKLITTEHSIIVQTTLALIITFFGFYFQITREEWLFQNIVIGMVLAIEGLNTAVEKIADFIHPDYHEKIGFIKDISAGAVFFVAITALIVGVIIYYPYITQ